VPAVRGGLRRAGRVLPARTASDALVAAGIEDLEERFDGLTGEREHLAGKLTPDMFLACRPDPRKWPPDEAAVFGDALARVVGGRAGGFGFVVAVGSGPGRPASLRLMRWTSSWPTLPSCWRRRDQPSGLSAWEPWCLRRPILVWRSRAERGPSRVSATGTSGWRPTSDEESHTAHQAPT